MVIAIKYTCPYLFSFHLLVVKEHRTEISPGYSLLTSLGFSFLIREMWVGLDIGMMTDKKLSHKILRKSKLQGEYTKGVGKQHLQPKDVSKNTSSQGSQKNAPYLILNYAWT